MLYYEFLDEVNRAKARELKAGLKRTVEGIEKRLTNLTLQHSEQVSLNSVQEALDVLHEVKDVLSSDTKDVNEFNNLYMRYEEIRPFVPALDEIKVMMDSLQNNREMCIVINPCDEYDDEDCADVSSFDG